MLIHNLILDNYRCFEHFELPLEPGFNLLIGDNGAGKTALLDALMLGLGGYFYGFRTKLQPAPGLGNDDARRVVSLLGESVDMQSQYPVRIACEGTVSGRNVKWCRMRSAEERKTTVRDARSIIDWGAKLQKLARSDGAAVDLPVFAYYGTERLWLQLRTHRSSLKLAQTRTAGYRYCLARESNTRYVAEWMKHRTLSYLQEQMMNGAPDRPPIMPDVLLQTISDAVCSCIENAKDFYYNMKYKELFLRFRDQHELPFYMLSDGVRGMLQLVAALAWRAVVLNPHLGQAALRCATGVVLIDELDLALHPRWQLRVINDLLRVFPKLQFVATTHSPLILAGANGANVLRLEGNIAYPQRHVYGQDSNTVLVDNMGGAARPPEMQERLDAVARLIDEDRVKDAQEAIVQLESLLGADNTELVRLRTALAFLYPPDRGGGHQ